MVSFSCEVSTYISLPIGSMLGTNARGSMLMRCDVLQACGDVLTKKKLDAHHRQCQRASFTCLDCMTHFRGTDYKSHTVREYIGPFILIPCPKVGEHSEENPMPSTKCPTLIMASRSHAFPKIKSIKGHYTRRSRQRNQSKSPSQSRDHEAHTSKMLQISMLATRLR